MVCATERTIFFSSRRRHTRYWRDWSSDVCSSDLYTLALELLPKIELGDFKGIKLQRQVAEVTDAQVNEALDRIAGQNRPFAAKAQGAKGEKGDRVVIDLVGKADGAAFEGGRGCDV